MRLQGKSTDVGNITIGCGRGKGVGLQKRFRSNGQVEYLSANRHEKGGQKNKGRRAKTVRKGGSGDTLENVYAILQAFDALFDKMAYLVKEVQINANDEGKDFILKSIEFNFPVYKDKQEGTKPLCESDADIGIPVCLDLHTCLVVLGNISKKRLKADC